MSCIHLLQRTKLSNGGALPLVEAHARCRYLFPGTLPLCDGANGNPYFSVRWRYRNNTASRKDPDSTRVHNLGPRWDGRDIGRLFVREVPAPFGASRLLVQATTGLAGWLTPEAPSRCLRPDEVDAALALQDAFLEEVFHIPPSAPTYVQTAELGYQKRWDAPHVNELGAHILHNAPGYADWTAKATGGWADLRGTRLRIYAKGVEIQANGADRAEAYDPGLHRGLVRSEVVLSSKKYNQRARLRALFPAATPAHLDPDAWYDAFCRTMPARLLLPVEPGVYLTDVEMQSILDTRNYSAETLLFVLAMLAHPQQRAHYRSALQHLPPSDRRQRYRRLKLAEGFADRLPWPKEPINLRPASKDAWDREASDHTDPYAFPHLPPQQGAGDLTKNEQWRENRASDDIGEEDAEEGEEGDGQPALEGDEAIIEQATDAAGLARDYTIGMEEFLR